MPHLVQIPWSDLVAAYGYALVFGIIMLESAGIPAPGETVLILAAVFAGTTGELDIGSVILAASAAAILGDNIGFWVGRRFGFPLLVRHGPKIGLTPSRLKLAQYLFLRHGGKIVFFGRFTPLLRAFAAVLAGANAYPARRFFAYNAAGGVAWATLVGLGGFLVGKSIEHAIGPFGLLMLAAVVVSSVLAWRFVRRHEARLSVEAESALPGPVTGQAPVPAIAGAKRSRRAA